MAVKPPPTIVDPAGHSARAEAEPPAATVDWLLELRSSGVGAGVEVGVAASSGVGVAVVLPVPKRGWGRA